MIRTTLYRDRAIVLPKIPKNITDFVVPSNLTKNLYNESMLFCDQKKSSRILGFASLTALQQLGTLSYFNISN